MCIDPGKENHCFPRMKNFQNCCLIGSGICYVLKFYKLSVENKNLLNMPTDII